MKNLLLSIYLLLMSGSALAQENVLSETWDQKLDLTIPSSEMPLISALDSKGQTRNYAGVDLLLSARTVGLCTTFSFREVDRIKVKGKEERVTIFTV